MTSIPSQTPVASGSAPLQGSTSGVLAGFNSLGGMDFWSTILSQFPGMENGSLDGKSMLGITNMPVQTSSRSPVNQSSNPLAMLQVALAAQSVDAQGNLVLSQTPVTPEKLQTQLDLTNKVINHIQNMLPENGDAKGMLENVLSKLQAKSDTLQASLSALEGGVIAKDTPVEDIPLPMLVALGLNPAEISEVTEHIQTLEKKLGRDITVEDLIAGVGGIIAPAQQAQAAIVLTTDKTKSIDGITGNLDETAQPTDELAARLNALEPGAASDPDANLQSDDSPSQKNLGKEKDYTAENGLPEPDAKAATENTKKAPASFKENLVNTLTNANGNNAQKGDMTFPASMFGTDANASALPSFAVTSPALGTTAQAANIVSSSATAGQSHPATQMVAATLVRQGKDGGDSVMTVRLDPPELGNVSVRLQIAKDKSVKAHITVEKSETYNMLQRDGHSLERALQSAGLDAKTDSISFELAQDNSAFSHDNNGKGANENNFGRNGGSGTENASPADEIIQSSVTWQVDPSTGRVRYNIFA